MFLSSGSVVRASQDPKVRPFGNAQKLTLKGKPPRGNSKNPLSDFQICDNFSVISEFCLLSVCRMSTAYTPAYAEA